MNKFTYNQELATQIGGGQYVTKSGGYDLKIVRAEFTKSPANSSEFLELDFETREGLKLNYVSINFIKGDGGANEFGQKMINAIMGCTGQQNLSVGTDGKTCPELVGKHLKGVVQRVDYTKQSGQNAGKDGYKFEFKLPAHIQTGQTMKEFVEKSEAKSFASYADSIEDKDERATASSPQNQGGFQPQQSAGQAPAMGADFDDDLPF